MRFRFSTGTALIATLMATPAPAFEAADPFVASRDAASFDRSLECLTQAIYYEARSESDDGQRAVAQVVLNRVRHPNYPSSVCGVVFQGSHRTTGCQFSFTCDGSMGAGINNQRAWERAERIARAALRGDVYRPVGLATHYHTTAISPYWAPSLVPQVTLGAHIFYRSPGYGSAGAFGQTPSDDNAFGALPITRGGGGVRLHRNRVARERVEQPVLEIPVLERPVTFRTLSGGRPAAFSRASAGTGAGATPVRAVAQPERRAPRVTYQGGVRIMRGS